MNTQTTNTLNFTKVVNENGQVNLIPTPSSFVSNIWFNSIERFQEGVACVSLNGKHNYIGTNGQLLFDTWFTDAFSFSNGWGCVRDFDGKWNFINHNGEFISKEWFDFAAPFREGVADVCVNGEWTYIDTTGNIINDVDQSI